jgi:hypothetical protein
MKPRLFDVVAPEGGSDQPPMMIDELLERHLRRPQKMSGPMGQIGAAQDQS